LDAEIFKGGGIFIFCEFDNRGYEPDPVDILYTVTCETDIMKGLEFDISVVEEHELLGIDSCEKVSGSCYKLDIRILAENEVENREIYLQRLLTLEERIAETLEKYGAN